MLFLCDPDIHAFLVLANPLFSIECSHVLFLGHIGSYIFSNHCIKNIKLSTAFVFAHHSSLQKMFPLLNLSFLNSALLQPVYRLLDLINCRTFPTFSHVSWVFRLLSVTFFRPLHFLRHQNTAGYVSLNIFVASLKLLPNLSQNLILMHNWNIFKAYREMSVYKWRYNLTANYITWFLIIRTVNI